MKSRERNDIIISYVTITLAFAWAMARFNISEFAVAIPIVALTVGLGFILHELGHRAVAKHYKAHAEYRMWTMGLVFALLLSFTGFVFAAPGAVYIYGSHIDRKQNGIISYAGPLVNIIIAGFFFLLGLAFAKVEILATIASFGVGVNLFLALFNLLPVPPLDGSKVFAWNKALWIITFVPLAVLVAIFWFRF